ncbi:MAG TPA: WD40 repeat domain-containing protein, partial [Phenylobacterium sp.]|nr:WD40 repeat domain-containing protein [Phenylobacterium sp.]
AAEVGFDASTRETRVEASPTGQRVAAGLEDGRVWVCDLVGQKTEMLKAEKGPPITALAITPDGRRVAWGDEDGGAGVAEAP